MLKFNVIKELLALSAFFRCTRFDVFSSATVGNSSVPEPAKPVELSRYLGRWYELGSYPAPFQDGCLATHADYGLAQDGSIRVLNSCHKGSVSGKEEVAEGRAEVVEGSNNAKLKVSFFGPFYGDYWVLDHAADYSWSIVGEPSGRYLWLLSRTAHPPKATLKHLENRATEMGYDLKMLKWTEQP